MPKRARDEITSESESLGHEESADESDDFFQSPEEKKVKLAKEVLAQLGPGVRATPAKTTIQRAEISFGEPVFLRGHKNTPTCACAGPAQSVFTGGKDGAVLQWNLAAESKEVVLSDQHRRHVSALAFHSSANALVTCGDDLFVSVHRLDDLDNPVHLKGHRKPPVALVANPPGGELDTVFSTGADCQLRQWSLTHSACLKTLYGHTRNATSLAIFSADRPLSGGEDGTVRSWKVENETHLLFQLEGQSVDAIACISPEFCVIGTQTGDLLLLSSSSKKPVSVVRAAHGGGWIQSLCALPGTDLFFSGSNDGVLRVWRAEETQSGRKRTRELRPEASFEVPGFINAIVATESHVVACVGRDGRLGRWETANVKNGVWVVPFSV